MITVDVAINGTSLHHIEVVNRGPLGGTYVGGDWPGGGGPRVYRWTCGEMVGEVVHERASGAPLLAAAVLLAVDAAMNSVVLE